MDKENRQGFLDVHHGNGTQHSFEEDRDVLYFSTHQFPFYPGTGDLIKADGRREVARAREIEIVVAHASAAPRAASSSRSTAR